MNTKNTLLTVVLFLLSVRHAGACIYTSPSWDSLKTSRQEALIATPSFPPGDETCLIAFLNRINSVDEKKISLVQIINHLKNYSASSRSFSTSVLHAAVSLNMVKKQPHHAISVLSLWEYYNGPFRTYCTKLEERGLFNVADTLYTDAYAVSLLDAYDVLKWARIKGVLGKYDEAALVYCSISRKENDFESIARIEFEQVLNDAPSPAIQQRALETYHQCYLAKQHADTLAFSTWEGRIAARYGLFALEDAAMLLDKRNKSRGLRFLDAARYRFTHNNFAAAIPAARYSLPDLAAETDKQAAALILYQSYLAVGKKDSALIWLEKTANPSSGGIIETVVLYQRTGHMTKADSTIKTMRASMAKDTLAIRQYLFTHDTASARAFTARRTHTDIWTNARPAALFWLLRIAVFSGRLDDVARYLDSIQIVHAPSLGRYTAELLGYQVAAQQFAAYPDAFIAWGNIQYGLFCEHPEKAIPGFTKRQWPGHVSELLGTSLVEALVQEKQYDSAHQVLSYFSDPYGSARRAYLNGVVNDKRGFHEKARTSFEKIIMTFPDDVFAHKARIYLLTLKQNNRL